MLFPDIVPSRDECLAAMAQALLDDKGRIYLDASVLIHCYEMNVLASTDLVSALEAFGPRVCIPAWAAKETWDYATTKSGRTRPLQPLADRMRRELSRFQKESTRYIDDDTLTDLSKDEFQHRLDEAFSAAVNLAQRVANYEPKADQTTAKLLPFIDARRVPSDLSSILDTVTRTAAARLAHRIPPGFGDSVPVLDEQEDESKPRQKGKQKNPHGDLIIWLEILDDCVRHDAEHLILITRDTTKDDWVYVPKKIRDDKGRPQPNSGLTLPHPLLVHEAIQRCPTLKSVHIASVEMLAHTFLTLKVDVKNLAAALQAGDTEIPSASTAPDGGIPAKNDEDSKEVQYVAKFDGKDMVFELSGSSDLDRLIGELSGEGWAVQNQAARALEPILSRADRDQRVQIGRGLVAAGNDGAVEPGELLARILGTASLGRPLRSDVMIGALAEVYISDSGDPKKPEADPAITDLIFRFDQDPELQDAYRAVVGRLRAQARKYLALPTDHPETLAIEVGLQREELRGVAAFGNPLLEEDAPPNRALQRSGRPSVMTTDELVAVLAREFVVPAALLSANQSRTAQFTVPELLGFAHWGPSTGRHLR